MSVGRNIAKGESGLLGVTLRYLRSLVGSRGLTGVILISVVSLLWTTDSFSFHRTEKLYLSVDYALFRGDSARSFVEIYYSVGVNQLRVSRDGDRHSVGIRLEVSVKDLTADTVVVQRTWGIPHVFQDSSEAQSTRNLVGVLNLWIEPGRYKLKVTGVDMNDVANLDTTELPLNLRGFSSDSLAISDIELCNSIKQMPVDKQNIFYKNTLEVVPNPTVIYGLGLHLVYYYVEVYNLLSRAKGGDYVYTTSISDASGIEIVTQRRRKMRAHDSSVEVGMHDISKLKSGTYVFRFSLWDSLSGQTATGTKKFFVYNPSITKESNETKEGGGDYLGSEYGVSTEQELDKEVDYVRYFAPRDELERYDQLTGIDSKRKFLYEFWKRRDPDPSTPGNEFKQEYLSRVSYASLNFRTTSKEGWRTDRGRVYILYGRPDEIERHPNEVDTRPYEIWYFHQMQGGVQFVFVDKSNFQDYRLIHSTHRNELRDDRWTDQLAK